MHYVYLLGNIEDYNVSVQGVKDGVTFMNIQSRDDDVVLGEARAPFFYVQDGGSAVVLGDDISSVLFEVDEDGNGVVDWVVHPENNLAQ
jgi:hypothetical protein